MRKLILLFCAYVTIYSANAQIVSDSVTMGTGYANDIFYSLKNGNVKESPNANWHLAFRSGLQTDGIFINSTANVKAFLTTADTTKWLSLDSSFATTELFNTDTSWEIGAFNRTFDNPYSSWGIYNTITKIVSGDSLYLIKVNNNWIKLWIVEKNYGSWKVRVANKMTDTTIYFQSADLKNKLFGYLNLMNFTKPENEPADTSWDIKFTRYAALQLGGTYYPSTGVLNNKGVSTAKVTQILKTDYKDYASKAFVNNISTIGADWKSFDNGTFEWKVADSTVYFIKVKSGDIYKLYFTGFGGSSSGKSYFITEKLFTTGIKENLSSFNAVSLYPNPASSNVKIVIDALKNLNNLEVEIYNINGAMISQESVDMPAGLNTYNLSVESLNTGIYFIKITSEGFSSTHKLVVAK